MSDSKMPLHIQKALSGGSPEEQLTDYRPTEPMVTVTSGVHSSHRTPSDRAHGNDTFRRYADGTLDIEYAKHKVLDMVHKVRDKHPLNNIEQCILTCCFPEAFYYMDPDVAANIRAIALRVTPREMLAIAMAVSSHLAEEMNYNAGKGGGSTPGRSQTRV